jgi:hypothetical protein
VVDSSDGTIYYTGNNYQAAPPGALLRSRDRGRSWEDFAGPTLQTREVWWLAIDPGRQLFASSYGSGLWIRDLK